MVVMIKEFFKPVLINEKNNNLLQDRKKKGDRKRKIKIALLSVRLNLYAKEHFT